MDLRPEHPNLGTPPLPPFWNPPSQPHPVSLPIILLPALVPWVHMHIRIHPYTDAHIHTTHRPGQRYTKPEIIASLLLTCLPFHKPSHLRQLRHTRSHLLPSSLLCTVAVTITFTYCFVLSCPPSLLALAPPLLLFCLWICQLPPLQLTITIALL